MTCQICLAPPTEEAPGDAGPLLNEQTVLMFVSLSRIPSKLTADEDKIAARELSQTLKAKLDIRNIRSTRQVSEGKFRVRRRPSGPR